MGIITLTQGKPMLYAAPLKDRRESSDGMGSHLVIFISEVLTHWLAIAGGSVVSLGLLAWEKWSGTPVKWKTILLIFSLGVAVSLFFAWQDEYTSAEWRGGEVIRLSATNKGDEDQIKVLQGQLAQKDRPITLQYATDPAILKLLNRQTEELAQLKSELPSPKKRALQVSNGLLKLLADRQKAQPGFPFPTESMTQDDVRKQQNTYEQAREQWTNETLSAAQSQFALPVAQVLQDMKDENIDLGKATECRYWVNDFMIQGCAMAIGGLAQKLSH